MLAEGQPEVEKNYLTEKDDYLFEDLSSLLYAVPFDLPVVKVVCGD